MKPISFKESNKVLQKPQSMTDKECGSLEVFHNGAESISCWKAESFKERIKFLFSGIMWLGVYFRNTQPPIYLTVDKPIENYKPELNQK